MRVLLVSPNYHPELTGIPPLVTEAAEWLATRGHLVDVVTPFPNYPERLIHSEYRKRLWARTVENRVNVHRSWLRVRPQEGFVDKALYEASWALTAAPVVARLGRRTDIVVAVIPTLLSAAVAELFASVNRRPFVAWVQDIVPLAARSVVDSRRSNVLRLLERLELQLARRANRVVVCSPGFADYYVARGVQPSRIDVLYNWVNLNEISPSDRLAGDGPSRVLYAGNIGYTQGLETLIEAAKIAGQLVDVSIVGAGNASAAVRSAAEGADNVTVYPPVSRDAYAELVAGADMHVVIQRRIGSGANLPSKIGTGLASGRPVVASLDLDSPAASLLRDSGGAMLVEPEDPAALARAFETLARDPDLRTSLGRAGRSYAETNLSSDGALRRLEQILADTLPAAHSPLTR